MKIVFFRFFLLSLILAVSSAVCRGQELRSSQNPTHPVHWGVGEGLHSSVSPESWINGIVPVPVDSGHVEGAGLKQPEIPVGNLDVKKASKTDAESGLPKGRLYETGQGTYYSARTHGRMMANGTRYDKNELFCAHKKLPFGTKIRVVNKKNGREVIVDVRDRGPFAAGRVIDLSNKAAEVLGMLSDGVVPVELWVIDEKSEE
ncbi:MAG: septal ring lytic transglycosylase RlpA family protein [Bacteroidaceae bacterium]|nr:septal ring lytic transglycosylase RlpA family protein [Bacteroidaceae bacterium]